MGEKWLLALQIIKNAGFSNVACTKAFKNFGERSWIYNLDFPKHKFSEFQQILSIKKNLPGEGPLIFLK